MEILTIVFFFFIQVYHLAKILEKNVLKVKIGKLHLLGRYTKLVKGLGCLPKRMLLLSLLSRS